MGVQILAQRLFHVEIRRLLLIIGLVFSILVVSQCFALPYVKTFYFSPSRKDSNYELASDTNSTSHKELMLDKVVIVGSRFQTGADRSMDNISSMEKVTDYRCDLLPKANKATNIHGADNDCKTRTGSTSSEDQAGSYSGVSEGIFIKGMRNLNADSVDNIKKRHEEKESELLQSYLAASNDNLTIASISVSKRLAKQATTISEMNSLLLQSPLSSHSMVRIQTSGIS